MNDPTSVPFEPIRLVFQLERADNPRLYDDLIRFKKGAKRVNRLRTLAQEGLLAQQWSVGFGNPAMQVREEAAPRDVGDAAITNQVFDAPIAE
ncbi:MAG TPA: hypothetical protein VGE12_17505 [Noviherbaspirillum sp.]